MSASEVMGKYHELWHVERSFRMSKTDLRARPIFHHVRESIEAHLSIVFTALAVSHAIQDKTGLAIANVVKQLRPLRRPPSPSTAPARPSRRRSPTPKPKSWLTSESERGTKQLS
jgi:hypothetical protein